MHKILVLVLLLLLARSTFAQFTITGVIKDSDQNRPLPGANILLVGTLNGTTSDESGKYRLAVPAGIQRISVSFVGYRTLEDTVDVESDLRLDYAMHQISLELTEPVILHATRASESTPTTFTNIDSPELRKQNFGQDLPILLTWTPSVVTTSDAGTGIGYTGIRIRGSDATRTNVTINGIPYNDSESQSTFWVDIPDIASSTRSVQIQRGVGTSTNGAGAFGGAINLDTRSGVSHIVDINYAEAIAAAGSFGSQRYTLKGGYYLGPLYLEGKISKIKSDGYVERASSDLSSYYFKVANRELGAFGFQAIAFGGAEKTYQAWYGVDQPTLQTNRRMNYAGAIYDTAGNVASYYSNQVDDYRQDHGQLHFSYQVSNAWDVKLAFHGTYGRGFYEEYQQDRSFASVGLPDYGSITSTDLVVRKWLDNYFYGITYSANYSSEKSAMVIGGAASWYEPARHFGEINWAKETGSVTPGYRYYEGRSDKGDRNIFVKWSRHWTERFNSFVDLQYRSVNYETAGIQDDQSAYGVSDQFHFFNPKIGIQYKWGKSTFWGRQHWHVFYASYSIANREPNRTDYLEVTTKPRSERLFNLEAGFKRHTGDFDFDINYYLMHYQDQLVQTGALDPGGYPVRANVGNSYRTGVELSGIVRFSYAFTWSANTTLSLNQNKDYVVFEGATPVVRDTKIILSPGLIAGSQFSWRPFEGFEGVWLSKYVGDQYLDNTESSAVRLPEYWVNDFRFSYEITPKGFKSIAWSFLINNAFDTLYSSNGAAYGGTPYYFPQAGRNFMVMMTVRL